MLILQWFQEVGPVREMKSYGLRVFKQARVLLGEREKEVGV